ncbi:Hsp70 family protein [Nocardia uniformis]|uniref:Hsp70 family protein n=1 Tax=Nocardia uniformis TaxID=53432 RepID=A0A849CA09_9NOCA|nr:Hsp70 family protein [Nocardia uniformis]NNH75464.1 Hsp70 family protein [Nocardia uniformis]
MGQGQALGITVGSLNTVAVTTSGGNRRLHILPSLLGSAAEVPESILSRVGDPVDIRTGDGSAVRAADLVAAAIGRALDDTGPAAATAACYPAWWSQHTVEVQRTALTAAGLEGVALVPEPAAAMRWLQEVHESVHDGAMAVYDLGATGLTVSVVRTGPLSGLLGEPVHSAVVSGTEFDLLAMRYVLANAVGGNDFDPFDPMVEQELAALRVRCRIAKESLSKKTAAVVPVRLPAFGMDVRLVRDELEELLRGPLLTSMDLLREAVRRAGLQVKELEGILLTGGGATIPLVTELLSTEFGIPVAAAADPAHISAHGAALLAADLLATTATEPHPALAAAPTAPIHVDIDGATDKAADADQPRGANPRGISSAHPAGKGRGKAIANVPDATDGTERISLSLPSLPVEPPPAGKRNRRRLVVISAAAIAVAALTTGTLALGTSMQSAPSDSLTPAPPSTTVAASNTTGSEHITGAPVAPIAVHPTGSPGSPAPTPGPGNTPSPANTTGPANTPGPGGTTGAPTEAAQPPAEPAAPPNQPPSDPAAAPQPPAVQLPAPQQPSMPTMPGLPTALPDIVDRAGSTVSTALDAPKQLVPNTGG